MSWSGFDEAGFVAEVERQLSAVCAAADELKAIARSGPKLPFPSLIGLLVIDRWEENAHKEDLERALQETPSTIDMMLNLILERRSFWTRWCAAPTSADGGQSAVILAVDTAILVLSMIPKTRIKEVVRPGTLKADLDSIIECHSSKTTITEPVHCCNRCGKPRGEVKLGRCACCGIVRYCGAECQRGAWKEHKKHCIPRSSASGK
ncbi:hypothetical protein DFJ74DRAFT_708952 [Hyaloraphidium curvatum]|nr:hypothetical protein DFJ74DRAFT_708952 [Hyaloraphidium curvatum]